MTNVVALFSSLFCGWRIQGTEKLNPSLPLTQLAGGGGGFERCPFGAMLVCDLIFHFTYQNSRTFPCDRQILFKITSKDLVESLIWGCVGRFLFLICWTLRLVPICIVVQCWLSSFFKAISSLITSLPPPPPIPSLGDQLPALAPGWHCSGLLLMGFPSSTFLIGMGDLDLNSHLTPVLLIHWVMRGGRISGQVGGEQNPDSWLWLEAEEWSKPHCSRPPLATWLPPCSLACIVGHHLTLWGMLVGLGIAAPVPKWRGSPHLPASLLTHCCLRVPSSSFLSVSTKGSLPVSAHLDAGFWLMISGLLSVFSSRLMAFREFLQLDPSWFMKDSEPKPKPNASLHPYCFLMLWSSSVEMVAITHKLHLSLKASDFGPLILLQNDGKLA